MAAGSNSKLVSFDCPVQVKAGDAFQAVVRFRNTGMNVWDPNIPNKPYIIGSQLPQDNATWGTNRWRFSVPVQINAELGLPLSLKAPDTPGTHTLAVRMLHEHENWFGDTAQKQIAVVANPIPPTPVVWPEPYPDADSMFFIEPVNTGGVPVNETVDPVAGPKVNIIEIPNASNRKVWIRYARIWAGLGFQQIDDVNADILLPNGSKLILFQEDHYAQRNTADKVELWYPLDAKIGWLPNGKLIFRYYANKVSGNPGGKVHFVVNLGLQYA